MADREWGQVPEKHASPDPHPGLRERIDPVNRALAHNSARPRAHKGLSDAAAGREIDAIISRLDVAIPRAKAEMEKLLVELRRPAAA